MSELRDLGYEEPLHYPTMSRQSGSRHGWAIGNDRRPGGKAVVSATASSRFVSPNFWRDPKSGVSYQVQVQIPQPEMTSIKDIETIPCRQRIGTDPLVDQVASVRSGTVPGELDRLNGQWQIALSANLSN